MSTRGVVNYDFSSDSSCESDENEAQTTSGNVRECARDTFSSVDNAITKTETSKTRQPDDSDSSEKDLKKFDHSSNVTSICSTEDKTKRKFEYGNEGSEIGTKK